MKNGPIRPYASRMAESSQNVGVVGKGAEASPAAASRPLTRADVARIAKLARLAPTEDQLETACVRLSAVLGYMERLQTLDLTGVEPLSHPGEQTNALADDAPGPTLPTSTLMDIAPAGGMEEPFIRIPKVLGDGGAA